VRIKRAGKWLLLCAIAAFSIFTFNAVAIYRFALHDETRNADCAIVAGAGVRGDIPGPVFAARLDHAIGLYREGKVNTLILTGGYSPDASQSDAAVARQYVLNHGIPASRIFIDEQSRVTRENIRNAKHIMTRQKLKTALLVSDPIHMLRMRLIARDDDIAGWSSPTPTSRYHSWSTQLPFLLRESFYYTGYRLWRLLPDTPVQKISTTP